ncbi:hypothetical protein [Flavobacterium sp.]
MLTEEHEIQIACTMILLDLAEQSKKEGVKSEDLEEAVADLKAGIESVWVTLNEDEKNQALERYKKERNNGELTTLPPIE